MSDVRSRDAGDGTPTAPDRYWVGYHQDSPHISVFDSGVRHPGDVVELVHVSPFDVPARSGGSWLPSDVIRDGRVVTDPALRARAIAAYEAWSASEEDKARKYASELHEQLRADAEALRRSIAIRERCEALESLVRRATAPVECGRSILDPPVLTGEDIELALCWYQLDDREAVRATWRRGGATALARDYGRDTASARDLTRVLSARAAERAAQEWLATLGYVAEDVSGLQRPGDQHGDWRRCDLRVGPAASRRARESMRGETGDMSLDDEEGFEVDVKNARRPRGRGTIYTRQTVGRFKEGSVGGNVRIVGMLSPFQWADVLLGFPPSEAPWNDAPLVALGWTTLGRLNALRAYFHEPGLLRVEHLPPGERGRFLLPPWSYDSPAALYRAREAAASELRGVLESDPSLLDLLERSRWQRVALATALGVRPATLGAGLSGASWQAGFLAQLERAFERYGRVLPVVYLTVLRHFTDRLTRQQPADDAARSAYHPSGYRRLLWCCPEDTRARLPVSGDTDHPAWYEQARQDAVSPDLWQFPAGVWDPLRTVSTLVDALGELWESDHGQLRLYREFTLTATNILQAVHGPTGERRTILAYCGGGDDGGPCGRFPLLLGRHRHCARGRLTCECDYCCATCQPHRATGGRWGEPGDQ